MHIFARALDIKLSAHVYQCSLCARPLETLKVIVMCDAVVPHPPSIFIISKNPHTRARMHAHNTYTRILYPTRDVFSIASSRVQKWSRVSARVERKATVFIKHKHADAARPRTRLHSASFYFSVRYSIVFALCVCASGAIGVTTTTTVNVCSIACVRACVRDLRRRAI